MTIPDFNTDGTTVEEVDIKRTHALEPGAPDRRSFEISHGPRTHNETIEKWFDRLINQEFDDTVIADITADRMYVDTDYADWAVTVEYHDPELDTYRVPLSPVGEVLVDATSPDAALEYLDRLYDAGELTAKRDRAHLAVALGDLQLPESPADITTVSE